MLNFSYRQAEALGERPGGDLRLLAAQFMQRAGEGRRRDDDRDEPADDQVLDEAGQRWFRRQQRWRSGQGATISLGRRKYGWRHSRLLGRDGAETWIGFGILTYNLDRMVMIGATR